MIWTNSKYDEQTTKIYEKLKHSLQQTQTQLLISSIQVTSCQHCRNNDLIGNSCKVKPHIKKTKMKSCSKAVRYLNTYVCFYFSVPSKTVYDRSQCCTATALLQHSEVPLFQPRDISVNHKSSESNALFMSLTNNSIFQKIQINHFCKCVSCSIQLFNWATKQMLSVKIYGTFFTLNPCDWFTVFCTDVNINRHKAMDNT